MWIHPIKSESLGKNKLKTRNQIGIPCVSVNMGIGMYWLSTECIVATRTAATNAAYRVRSLKGSLMRTSPTLPVAEGIVSRIALDEQDDPDIFIFGTPEPVNSSVLLTF
jgi:hypothetical protein